MTKTIRVGCASGFWGDSFVAAPQLIEHGRIDYLVFDYLSEITMSILARAMAKDPNAGYATDFVTVTMAQNAREIAARKIKVIANAGGINPKGCAKALEALLAKQGVNLKVAYVEGDDMLPQLDKWKAQGIREMFTGAPLPEVGTEVATEADAAVARLGCRIVSSRPLPPVTQAFTHFRLTLRPLLCNVASRVPAATPGHRWVALDELDAAPLPAPVRKLLAQHAHANHARKSST